MKSKKKHLNYRKTQKAGSSTNSTTSTIIRRSIKSLKSIVKSKSSSIHKNGMKQLTKLEDMITHIKITWRAMEKLNKDQIKTYNITLKTITKEQGQTSTSATAATASTNASTTATATTKVDKQRLKIHTETLQSSLALISQQRLQLNFLRTLTIKLRCLILKYICNKSPSIHPSLFQEYSTILEEIKKIYTKDDLVDMAIIKELYDKYKNSRNEQQIEFFQKLRSVIQIENKELKKLDSLSNTELAKRIAKKCSLDTTSKVRISNLDLKYFEPFDPGKHSETAHSTMSKAQSTILETLTAEPAAGSKGRKKSTKKRRKGKPMRRKAPCNL
jgi:hypothetical protein